jgi:hypothetical protein
MQHRIGRIPRRLKHDPAPHLDRSANLDTGRHVGPPWRVGRLDPIATSPGFRSRSATATPRGTLGPACAGQGASLRPPVRPAPTGPPPGCGVPVAQPQSPPLNPEPSLV